MICDDLIFNKSSDVVNYLKMLNTESKWFQERKAVWNQRDDPPFADVLTVASIGFSFNMLDMEEILNVDKLVRKFIRARL